MPAKKGKKQSKTSPRALATAKKMADAVNLRIQGYHYSEIGQALKVSTTRAYELVQKAWTEIIEEPAERARAISVARCDAMLTGFMKDAMNGDHAALEAVMKIEERRDRLLGIVLQVDHKHQHEGTVGVAVGGAVKHTMELVFVEPTPEAKVIEHVNGHAVNGNGSDNGA